MVIRFGDLVRRAGQRWSLARGGFRSLTAHAADPLGDCWGIVWGQLGGGTNERSQTNLEEAPTLGLGTDA